MERHELQSIIELVKRAPLQNLHEAGQVAELLDKFQKWCDEMCAFDDAGTE